MSKKKNDYSGLVLIAGLGLIGYLLYKSGVFGSLGLNNTGGGGGGYTTVTLPETSLVPTVEQLKEYFPNVKETTLEKLKDYPILEPVNVGFSSKNLRSPTIGATQYYNYLQPTKTGFIQGTEKLITTPLMVTNPALAQARAQILAGSGIDIGKHIIFPVIKKPITTYKRVVTTPTAGIRTQKVGIVNKIVSRGGF